MCGLAGGIGVTAETVGEMLDRIQHRGPDGRGVSEIAGAVHGHVRLALVDLTAASAQPFHRDGSVLTFNGEIWNYRALRDELKKLGEVFETTGDTEVLAATLNHWGINGVDKLDGMFAFVWTCPDQHTWVVRDRFGKVPVYIAKTSDGISWASERKAFDPKIQPLSVPPGYRFNVANGDRFEQWYKAPTTEPLTPSNVLARLREGVNKRLQADAPVCCLISGGLDSSIILALACERSKNVTAFTATFDKQTADAMSARRICKELNVRLIEVSAEPTDESIGEAIDAIEIPSKAQIEIAVLCLPLARRIYKEGFRACLSGEAADELFGGYGSFCIKANKASDYEIVMLRAHQLSKMARGNFVRCNKVFMAAGVECRLPFMEDQLVADAVQATKRNNPPGKAALKLAAVPILPGWVVKRRKDTFQGGSGVAGAIANRISNPVRFYNSELRRRFGYVPKD